MSIQTAVLTTTAANVYTSIGNSAITSMTICNFTSSDVLANIFLVPSGDGPSTSNAMLVQLPLQPTDTYQLYQAAEKILLGPGDSVYANASANASVTVVISSTVI